MRAYIIKTTGEKIVVKPKNGTDFSLEELKKAIGGGYIETVRIGDELLVIDEDGRRKDLPLNECASSLFRTYHPRVNDYIVGDALVCQVSQIK